MRKIGRFENEPYILIFEAGLVFFCYTSIVDIRINFQRIIGVF